MFECVMLAWRLELGAAIAVAAVGIGLWALPRDTPEIGRPPVWVGWLLIAIAIVIALLSSAGRIGLELQAPIRRRRAARRVGQQFQTTPIPPTPEPLSRPKPSGA